MAASIQINGLEELNRNLRALEGKLAKKLIKKAMRKALEPMRDAIRDAAPIGKTGQLRRAVRIKAGRGKNGRISYQVSISKKDFPKGFYGGAVEFDTSKHQGTHFAEKAFEATKARVLANVIAEMKSGFEAAAKS